MPRGKLLESLPIWLIFLGTMALVLLSIYGGIALARFRRKRFSDDEGTPVNAILGATTGLFTFILAFTFGLTASRFDTRRGLLLDEVNAMGTAFLRTRLIPEPHGTEVRTLLQEYVDLRVDLARHPEHFTEVVRRAERLQGLMWQHAAALAEADLKNPEIVALFVASLNEVFDMQTKRITVSVVYSMPTAMWMALLALTVLAMLEVGYLLGLSERANWLLVVMLTLALALVITLIADLDRSPTGGGGLIKIELQPMTDLQQWIQGQMGAG
jgi:hypothetical protein